MLEAFVFYTLAAALLGFSVVVITRTNPIAAALSMVGAFSVLAAIYALLSAKLAAVLQVLVYAGGIMVLVIFVIMLLNLRAEDLKPLRARGFILALALLGAGAGLMAPVFFQIFPEGRWIFPQVEPQFGGVVSVGEKLFSDYLFPFEMLSFLLLAAVVGALVLSKRKL
jgi:NADH-quinone oxidoreductase subunit J